MRVFLYEWASGGGMVEDRLGVPASLFLEGVAMLRALVADLCGLPDVEVVVLRDTRFSGEPILGATIVDVFDADQERTAFDAAVASCDAAILIAPEFDGALYLRTARVVALGGRLLSPSPAVVRLCGDKPATRRNLAAAGVPIPRGVVLGRGENPPDDFPFPAVAKPVDGAGSTDIRYTPTIRDLMYARRGGPLLLEGYCRGRAASVAMLCGPGDAVALPACWQRLSTDGRLRYLGGSLPLPSEENRRAQSLARRAIAALGEPVVGYIGVDLVLGEAADGAGDVVIEINPRLTTSYVGLRAAARTNLAAAMLAAARGEPFELSFRPQPIQFDADGAVRAVGD